MIGLLHKETWHMGMRPKLSFPLTVVVIVLFPKIGYAYLDPGTGSIMLQVMLATLFGLLFSIKRYWAKIVRFLRKKIDDKKTDPS